MEKAHYKAVLLLEDGFWRVRHLVKYQANPFVYKAPVKPLDSLFKLMKGLNYYPKNAAWDMYGKAFNTDTIAADFKIIKEAGLNSIRIFVPYNDFGKAKVEQQKIIKLKKVLDLALVYQLKVVVTLFDFYGDYQVSDWTLNHRHLDRVVGAFKDHKAILAWDIKNEPNLDFENRGKERVLSWLKYMISYVKSLAPNQLVTIGWSDIESAHFLKDEVDFISFHYYESLDDFEKAYLKLKKEIPNKPIVVGEFGWSSYRGVWMPFGGSVDTQAENHMKIQSIFSKHNISFLSWTLYDFGEVPVSVVGSLPWRKIPQKFYGFIDINGKKKPAFKYISH